MYIFIVSFSMTLVVLLAIDAYHERKMMEYA